MFFSGFGSCLGFNGRLLSTIDCKEPLPYICQARPIPHPYQIKHIPKPTLVLLLDNTTHQGSDSLVAFHEQTVPYTGLRNSAYYLGDKDSFTDIILEKPLALKTGVTISMWIKFTTFSDEKSVLVDFKNSNDAPGLTVFVKENSLKVKVCLPDECLLFESISTLQKECWTFLAFSMDNPNTGNVYINETVEVIESTSNKDKDRVISWSSAAVLKDSIRISSMLQDNDGKNNFHGKMSCFQLFSRYLSPPQINHVMQYCFLEKDHPQISVCPTGYFAIKNFCYKLSTTPMNYSMSELTCMLENQFLPHKLAYAHNYLIQEMLMVYALQLNVSEIWVGLDSMSGKELLLKLVLDQMHTHGGSIGAQPPPPLPVQSLVENQWKEKN